MMYFALQMEGENIFLVGQNYQEAKAYADLLWFGKRVWIVCEKDFIKIYNDQKKKGRGFTQVKVKNQPMIRPTIPYRRIREIEPEEQQEQQQQPRRRLDMRPRVFSPYRRINKEKQQE